MVYKSTVFYFLVLVLMVFYTVCSEKKSEGRGHMRLREKKRLELIAQSGNISPTPDFSNPRAEIEFQQRKNVEENFSDPCLYKIKSIKELLRSKIHHVFMTMSAEEIKAFLVTPNEEFLDIHAMWIAKMVLDKSVRSKKEETDEERRERYINVELNRFILPGQSHENHDPATISGLTSVFGLDDGDDIVLSPSQSPRQSPRSKVPAVEQESPRTTITGGWQLEAENNEVKSGCNRCCVVQ